MQNQKSSPKVYQLWLKKIKILRSTDNKLNLKLLIAAIIFVVSLGWLLRALFLGNYPDFKTQYFVPNLVFGGVNPYAGGANLFTPQVYPPTSIFFFSLFTILPFQIAPVVYTIFSILSLLLTLFLLSKNFNAKFLSFEFLILSSLSFISFPVKFTLGMGQVNLILLMFITLSLYFLEQKKKLLSGIVIGFPIVIKLFPWLLPIYFFLKLEKKIIIGILTTIFISIFLVILFISKNIYLEFLNIFPSLLNSWKLDYYNQAISGLIGRSFGVGKLSSSLKILISVILTSITFIVLFFKKTKSYPLIFGILITLNLIINTFSWQHHFVFLIIPFFACFFAIKKLKVKKYYFTGLIFSYFLVSINFRNPDVLPTILLSHVLFGSLLLLFIQLKLASNEKV